MRPCRWWHRWSAWKIEFEECPDGEMGVYEFRQRRCTRKRCDMIEEGMRETSQTLVVMRLGKYYREAL